MTVALTTHLPADLGLSDSRLRVLEAATGLLGERGFHGVSMRDLADALGIKGSSLYAHVSSKQHLLFEVTQIGLREYYSTLTAALLESGSAPDEQLRALVHAHVLMQLTYPALTQTCTRELRHLEPELQAQVVAIRVQAEQLFLNVVDRGVRLGRFTVTNPRRAMRAIADMGIRTAEWPRPEGDADEIANDYAGYALRLLA